MLKPASKPWSVVVVGRWNRAILTPTGIAHRLFELPEGTELFVEIPMDAVSPYRVHSTDGAVLVMAENDKVVIETKENGYARLETAMVVGRRLLASLPETPVAGVGINVTLSAGPDFTPFVDLFSQAWDRRIAAAELSIKERFAGRSIVWGDGLVNFSISQKTGEDFSTHLNFHRESKDLPDLNKWLGLPVSDIESCVNRVVSMLTDENQR